MKPLTSTQRLHKHMGIYRRESQVTEMRPLPEDQRAAVVSEPSSLCSLGQHGCRSWIPSALRKLFPAAYIMFYNEISPPRVLLRE